MAVRPRSSVCAGTVRTDDSDGIKNRFWRGQRGLFFRSQDRVRPLPALRFCEGKVLVYRPHGRMFLVPFPPLRAGNKCQFQIFAAIEFFCHKMMVRAAGIEPATLRFGGVRSVRLSYARSEIENGDPGRT
jgi:hypothetical protein